MARFAQPTKEQLRGWKRWVATRPRAVRVVAEQFEPWSLYHMKSTDHRVTVVGFDEGEGGRVFVRVEVSGRFNCIAFARQVFGVEADDLVACDLPAPDEVLGCALTQDEVWANLDALRVMVRPDLWAMDEHGKARRRQ